MMKNLSKILIGFLLFFSIVTHVTSLYAKPSRIIICPKFIIGCTPPLVPGVKYWGVGCGGRVGPHDKSLFHGAMVGASNNFINCFYNYVVINTPISGSYYFAPAKGWLPTCSTITKPQDPKNCPFHKIFY